MPNLVNLHERYASQGFDIVGVNLDNDVSAAVSFLEDQGLPWQSIMSEGNDKKNVNAEKLGVETIPFILLVDTEGKVVATHLRGEKIGESLGDMFESDDADVVIEMDDEVDATDADVEAMDSDSGEEGDDQPDTGDQSAAKRLSLIHI